MTQAYILPVLAAGGGFPTWLTPEWQVLVWSVVVFLTLLGMLWKFAWGPLMKALEDREHSIQHKIDEADQRLKGAEARVAEYEKRIAGAKEEAATIIAEGKRDVEKVRDEVIAAANAESQRTLERAKREISLAKDAALDELRDRVVGLTAELASKVIEREVKAEDHRRLIDEGIARVGKSSTN